MTQAGFKPEQQTTGAGGYMTMTVATKVLICAVATASTLVSMREFSAWNCTCLAEAAAHSALCSNKVEQ